MIKAEIVMRPVLRITRPGLDGEGAGEVTTVIKSYIADNFIQLYEDHTGSFNADILSRADVVFDWSKINTSMPVADIGKLLEELTKLSEAGYVKEAR